jgi:hypothetical protein
VLVRVRVDSDGNPTQDAHLQVHRIYLRVLQERIITLARSIRLEGVLIVRDVLLVILVVRVKSLRLIAQAIREVDLADVVNTRAIWITAQSTVGMLGDAVASHDVDVGGATCVVAWDDHVEHGDAVGIGALYAAEEGRACCGFAWEAAGVDTGCVRLLIINTCVVLGRQGVLTAQTSTHMSLIGWQVLTLTI